MLFSLVLVFPAATLASWLPIRPRQASTPDDCTLTSTLPPVTLTSVYPVSTIADSGQGQATGGGSLIYTTALPTLGPSGPGLHTYTITAPCPSAECQPPAATACPPGFTTAVVVCHVCGESPVTTVLTLPGKATASPNTDGSTNGSADVPGHGSDSGVNGYPACKGGSCVLGSAPTVSGFVKTTRPTSLDHARPTGPLSLPEIPAANNAGASVPLPQSPSSPSALHPQDQPQGDRQGAPGAADIPEHQPIPGSPKPLSAPPPAGSGSSPGSSETVEKPATVGNPGTGSSDSSKKPEAHTPNVPESSDSESSASSSSPSTLPESSTSQHPENPKLPESPEAPVSPTVPNAQLPATNSQGGTVGGGAAPEVVSSPEATPGAPTAVVITGSAPGSRVAKTTTLGTVVVAFLFWLPLYAH
ncbi:uncharacterized protein NECHADRAFT_78319 [Fusarium vanettenii 77-13-4]|uniref:Uncharacterized protein n=1 Tax=Fusarium vanettenii (strain ATCC MYA-4622 / CBS 123669 / FGSC 9596 / NRRL 45880 / 77-13-4) TaxID=660122 RepID=C7ZFH0_FUSV7|nr:uncharacterized protein NECHADRAFT_78319 [Fusarium vanettenii 77-13-4]EEU37243.1 predicted protein [Fusarium vanettenii 77-13-4]